MTRNRGWILLAFGLLLGIGAAVLIFLTLRQQSAVAAEQARAEILAANVPVATRPLPIAARPLEAGETITPDDYLMKEFPLDLVPVGAIATVEELDNQVLVAPVGQGETFSPRVLRGNDAARTSQRIKEGYVLFAFPIVDLMSKINIIQDGDRIDLLLTMVAPATDDQEGGLTTAITLQNIEVFQVLRPAASDEEDAPQGDAISLLLLMKPEDAVMVKYIKDSGGVIDFALRSSMDEAEVTAPAVNQWELFRRYEFK